MTLGDLTLTYWRISRVYESPDEIDMTVEEALVGLREVIEETEPKRPLCKLAWDLRKKIVAGPEAESSGAA